MCWAASRCTLHARELCGRGGKYVRRVLKYINRLGKWSWCECEIRDDCFKTYIMRIFMDQPCRKASAPYKGSLGHGVHSIAQSTATHMRGPQLDGGMGCKSQLYLFPETLPVSKTSSTSLSSFTSATLRSHATLSAQVELSAAARDVMSACVTSLSLGRKLHSSVGTGLLLCVAIVVKERRQKINQRAPLETMTSSFSIIQFFVDGDSILETLVLDCGIFNGALIEPTAITHALPPSSSSDITERTLRTIREMMHGRFG